MPCYILCDCGEWLNTLNHFEMGEHYELGHKTDNKDGNISLKWLLLYPTGEYEENTINE